MKYHDEEHHAQAYEDFEDALNAEPENISDLPWPAKMPSIAVLGSIFIFSLILIALSLLFRISVN